MMVMIMMMLLLGHKYEERQQDYAASSWGMG
jgi:hypothetical protein